MAEGRTILGESSVPSKQGQLKFDEIFEETIDTETKERQEKDQRQAVCDRCFFNYIRNVIALYMCVVCEKYFCEACLNFHNERNESHTVIRVKGESGENDGFDDFMNVVENESEKERNASLRKTNVCVCDYVSTRHELDKNTFKECNINGLSGYDNKWWVVCHSNYFIKVFSLSSNVLQREIRLGSEPRDVTEIIVENKTTERDSASCSETAISGTDNKPDRKHLLAVALGDKRLILILDLGKNPAVIHNKIKTEKQYFGIDFYDGNMYTVCQEPSLYYPYYVSIITVEGVTLKTVQTDLPSLYWSPYLTVLNGNIYITDHYNHRVVCYNYKGRLLHEIKIERSRPRGICIDRSEDKVYICSYGHNKVYELESDLNRYKSVLDQTTRYMEGPTAVCFYNDKLYVGNVPWSESLSHVTVIQLL